MNSNQIPLKARNHRGGKERAEKQTHKYSLMNLWQDNSTHLQWNTPESASAWISSWALTGYFPWTFTDLCRGHKVPPALLCTCAQVLPVGSAPPVAHFLLQITPIPPSETRGQTKPCLTLGFGCACAAPGLCQQGSSVISEPCARRSASHKRTSWPAQKGCTASPLPGIQHRRSSTKSREHFECFCHLAVPLMAHTASRPAFPQHCTGSFFPIYFPWGHTANNKMGSGSCPRTILSISREAKPPKNAFSLRKLQ